MEQWREIPGYEGLYEVSNCGRIRKGDRLKSLRSDKGGYLNVWLSKNGIQKCLKVHRLVALAFIKNPEGKRTINHKDGNKQNNNVENLEWATHSENIMHANETGLRVVTEAQRKAASITGQKTCDANRPRKPVICIKNGTSVEFESVHEGARFVNGSASAIVQCCKRKIRTYRGFVWRYKDAD